MTTPEATSLALKWQPLHFDLRFHDTGHDDDDDAVPGLFQLNIETARMTSHKRTKNRSLRLIQEVNFVERLAC